MINLKVIKRILPGGATGFELVPGEIIIGGKSAYAIDALQVECPDEWLGRNVRVTFKNTKGESSAYILDEDLTLTVTNDITKQKGVIVVDSFDNHYHAYTNEIKYVVYPHGLPGDDDTSYNPTEVEQVIQQIREHMWSESERAEAEQLRQNAEQERAEAELARVRAEEHRERVINAIPGQMAQWEQELDLAIQGQTGRITEAIDEADARVDATIAQAQADVRGLEGSVASTISQANTSIANTISRANANISSTISQADARVSVLEQNVRDALDTLVPPNITVKTQTPSEYVLTVHAQNATYDTPNLKGQDGEGSGDMMQRDYDSNADGIVNASDYATTAGSASTDSSGREITDLMERYVIRLVKNPDNTYKMTSIDDADLTFTDVYNITRQLNEYVVVIYGSSKLRPQYVSENEMMFIGLDRSTESKVLRIVYTPTRLAYETFKLAEASDVYTKSEIEDTYQKASETASVKVDNATHADSATNSSKVNNLTVETAVPANAKFTDTTYSSKSASSGGTDVSLVTTGEKYTWNSKTSNTGTVTSVAIKMNNTTKGTVTTSGTIDLGTVLTSHQSLSGYVPTSRTVAGHALTGNVTVSASDVGLGNVTNNKQMPIAGDTFTGNAVAYSTNRSGDSIRNIAVTNSSGTNQSTNKIIMYRK